MIKPIKPIIQNTAEDNVGAKNNKAVKINVVQNGRLNDILIATTGRIQNIRDIKYPNPPKILISFSFNFIVK